jgi:predicted transcriptional regulator
MERSFSSLKNVIIAKTIVGVKQNLASTVAFLLPFREGIESCFSFCGFDGLNLGSHRTSLQILADILDAVRGGARKTRIMYHANLSFRLLDRYLSYALETELVSAPCSDDCCYRLTPRGQEFLEKYVKYSMKSKQLEERRRFIVKEKALLEEDYLARMNNVESRNCTGRCRSSETQSSKRAVHVMPRRSNLEEG